MIKYPKMKKTIKTKWLAALRSGKFAQCDGSLRKEDYLGSGRDAYCCLGVLHFCATGKNPRLDKGLLSKNVCSAVGVRRGGVTEKLVEMNDGQGKSFKQIANWVEKYL